MKHLVALGLHVMGASRRDLGEALASLDKP